MSAGGEFRVEKQNMAKSWTLVFDPRGFAISTSSKKFVTGGRMGHEKIKDVLKNGYCHDDTLSNHHYLAFRHNKVCKKRG